MLAVKSRSNQVVGCAVEFETGFVMDFDFMKKFCLACSIAAAELGEDSPEYAAWQQEHAGHCQKNHFGSSRAMETSITEAICKRSVQYGFRITKLLSDGDVKTFNHLVSLNLHGSEYKLINGECITHVGQR